MDRSYDAPHAIKKYSDMSNAEKRYAHIMYPLCLNGDIESFKNVLLNYKSFLLELIPILYNKISNYFDVEDHVFGYFSFEVNSG